MVERCAGRTVVVHAQTIGIEGFIHVGYETRYTVVDLRCTDERPEAGILVPCFKTFAWPYFEYIIYKELAPFPL